MLCVPCSPAYTHQHPPVEFYPTTLPHHPALLRGHLDERVQDHRAALREVDRVGRNGRSAALVRVPSVYLEVLDSLSLQTPATHTERDKINRRQPTPARAFAARAKQTDARPIRRRCPYSRGSITPPLRRLAAAHPCPKQPEAGKTCRPQRPANETAGLAAAHRRGPRRPSGIREPPAGVRQDGEREGARPRRWPRAAA